MVKDKGQGVDPHIYDLLIYDQWVKKIYIIFNKRCFIGQKLKIKTQLWLLLHTIYKHSRWTADIQVKDKIIKLLDNNMKNIFMTLR